MNRDRCNNQAGLYVHLPWCVRKCPYCDFNSHALRDDVPERDYVAALLLDLRADLDFSGPVAINSVFIGGGTPSLFSPAAIAALLEGVHALAGVSADAEVTLEANPGTTDQARFRGFRAAGVNRLSLGIQSFDDGMLRRLGRIHDGARARAAVVAARAAGFDNLNLDLMYGLPGQEPGDARADVSEAVAFQPEHLSHYQLTIEPNTLFHRSPPALPHEDALWLMQTESAGLLATAGFEHYEVSAWAQPGRGCRHNLNYWRFGNYLGVGAGAHGKIARADGTWRSCKKRHPGAYLRAAGGPGRLDGRRPVSAADLVFEYMLNRLRLADGFGPGEFAAATGLSWDVLREPLECARAAGLLETGGGRWWVSGRGQRFLNDLQALFLPPETAAEPPARRPATPGVGPG